MSMKETVEQLSIHENLIKLYSTRTTPDFRIERNYQELHNFKKQIDFEKSSLHYKPYESMFKQALFYRLTFIGLGSLFFFLMIFMYGQSINWLPYSYIFSNDQAAKNVMLSLCFFLSVSAFSLSLMISAEKEALYQFVKRAKRKLLRIHNKKLIRTHEENELKKLHQSYSEALDKVTETKESVKLLLHSIGKSKDPKKMVRLYNEALLEANDHLHGIINQFKKL